MMARAHFFTTFSANTTIFATSTRLTGSLGRTLPVGVPWGQSPLLKGFTSKARKSFDARLKLENGAVRFEFDP